MQKKHLRKIVFWVFKFLNEARYQKTIKEKKKLN